MPVTSTPQWSAPQAGIIGDAAAIAGSAAVNQFLGTHADGLVYTGTLAPNDGANNGLGGTTWGLQLATQDVDMPVTLTGTSLGRVVIPVLCVGDGADLLVSLCADNAGAPGTVITQTRMPASHLYQLSAVSSVSVPSSQAPSLQYTGNPLATGQFNSLFIGPQTTKGWSYPAGSGGPAAGPSSAVFGNYFIQVGGFASSTYYSNVYSISFDTAGNLAQAVPQPSLPVATNGAAGSIVSTDSSGNNTLIVAGGTTASGLTNAVWAAGFNAATGVVSAWSSQAALPVAQEYFGTAAYNGYIYAVGGQAASSFVNTVYYAQVQNGQITAWKSATPLPESVYTAFAYALDGFLIVFGGAVNFSSPTPTTATYYAPINADGSLGAWRTGPTLPFNAALGNGNAQPSAGSYGLFGTSGQAIYELGVTTAGLDVSWRYQVVLSGFGNYFASIEASPGLWRYYGLSASSYVTMDIALTPMISVPLPATGLTNGGTYHILMQQQGGDLNNYLRLQEDNQAQNLTTTAQTSPRGGYTWTALTPQYTQVPLELWSGTPVAQGLLPLHSWEDNGARVTTVVCATTPDRSFLGLCDAVAESYAQNANQGFQTGISPWNATGGAAVQSSTQYFEGGLAAQVTPSGSAATVYLQSEMLPCMPGQSVSVEGRLWFTSAVTSNASMSVNWYTLAGAYISTSSNNVSVPAATWTDLANTFTAPAGAYQYTINPALSGTPASSNVFYVDLARGYLTTAGPQLGTVIGCEYPATWPGATWPLLSTSVLA